jgi:methionyl-tRNA formyltransferase
VLRVAFFGSDGEFSGRSLAGVAARHAVVAIVAPPAPRRTLLSLLRSLRGGPRFSLARLARAPMYHAASGNDTVALAAISDTRPDVICIAGYPWLIPPDVFLKPRLGAVNLHGSLLPRHRGILPLFWIYHHDDRDTGVTVHRVTERADAGAILGQDSFALPRGLPVDSLNSMNAERGGALLAATLDALVRGSVAERVQDERLATPAPRVVGGVSMVDFEHWGVERVWHFLAGLYPHFQEPLVDGAGGLVRYRGVRGFRSERHDRSPGHVERTARGSALYCRDGIVELW